MTTTTAKPARTVDAAKPAMHPEDSRHRTRRLGREVGTLAVNAYERGIGDIVALEKDAAEILQNPWMKSALSMSAELIEEVGAAYVKTARQVLK
jgi:limonene-1,2-epoxide hydrolase